MKKLPSIQFYTGDWLKDPRLSMCSALTRGIWMDFLCAMHELDRVGELRGTTDQLARVARCSPVEVVQALDELSASLTAGITQRNGVYTVINRRMKREYTEREKNKEYVSNHRQKQNVRFCKTDVRNTQVGVNKGVDDENESCKANVRIPSSSSSSNNLHSSSSISSASANESPPISASAAAAENSENETKAKEKRLDDLQAKYQQIDVRRVRKKYLDHCQRSGKEANWKIFEVWLKNEGEPMESESKPAAPFDETAFFKNKAKEKKQNVA